MMKSSRWMLLLLVLLSAVGAAGQPDLAGLWPNADGLRFDFQYTWADAARG